VTRGEVVEAELDRPMILGPGGGRGAPAYAEGFIKAVLLGTSAPRGGEIQ
jgi:hypothetical protein